MEDGRWKIGWARGGAPRRMLKVGGAFSGRSGDGRGRFSGVWLRDDDGGGGRLDGHVTGL